MSVRREKRRLESTHSLKIDEVPSIELLLNPQFLELVLAGAIVLDNLTDRRVPRLALLGLCVVGGGKGRRRADGAEIQGNGGVGFEEVDEVTLEEHSGMLLSLVASAMIVVAVHQR